MGIGNDTKVQYFFNRTPLNYYHYKLIKIIFFNIFHSFDKFNTFINIKIYINKKINNKNIYYYIIKYYNCIYTS